MTIEGQKIKEIYGRGGLTPKGDLGLEIEVEGSSLPQAPSGWVFHTDHSLRGEYNGEFVLDGPVSFDEGDRLIDSLWAAFEKKATKFDASNRTSTHVHLNVNEFYVDRLAAFSALWFTFEDILTHWCGEHRVGNLFCLRAKDAPYTVTVLERFIRNNGHGRFPERLHYAAFNPNAIEKFGSIELRTLRGTSEKATVKTWVRALRNIYEASERYSLRPPAVCEDFSSMGSLDFFNYIVGEPAAGIYHDLKWSEEDFNRSLWEGARIAQDLAFCLDWSNFSRRPEGKSDPFGRGKKGESAGRRTAEEILQEFAGQDVEVVPDGWAPRPQPVPGRVNRLPRFGDQTRPRGFGHDEDDIDFGN